MHNDHLAHALKQLGAMPDPSAPDGFMDGVWLRAGQLEEISARRSRLALFVAVALVGLGAGFETALAPAKADPVVYAFVDGHDLSPASLLHVEP